MKKIKERLVLWTLAIYLVFFICLIPVGYISNRFVNQLESFYAANLIFVIGLISLISLACLSALWVVYGTGNFLHRFFFCGFVFLLAGLAFEQSRCLIFWGESPVGGFDEWWIGNKYGGGKTRYLPMLCFLPVWCLLIGALSALRIIPFLRWKIQRPGGHDNAIIKQFPRAVGVRVTMLAVSVLGTCLIWNLIFRLSFAGILSDLRTSDGAILALVCSVAFLSVSLLLLIMVTLTRFANWLFYQRKWLVIIAIVINTLTIGISIRYASDPRNLSQDWHVVWIVFATGLLLFETLLMFGIVGYRIRSKDSVGKEGITTDIAGGGIVVKNKRVSRFHPLEQLTCLGFLFISVLVIPTGFHQKLVVETWASGIRFDDTGELVGVFGNDFHIPDDWAFLEGSSRLESVSIGSNYEEIFVSKESLNSLIELNGTLNSGLKKLEFYNCRFEDPTFEFILQFPLLEELAVYETTINNDDIIYLKSLKNLKHLRLPGANISGKGIGDLKGLETLNLRGTGVTDKPMDQFDNLKNLKTIYITDNGFSSQAKSHLHKTHPGIIVYDNLMIMLGYPNPLLLSAMVQRNSEGCVTSLNLTGKEYYEPPDPRNRNYGIEMVMNYALQFPKLRALNLARTGMEDEALPLLEEFHALEHVDLSGNNITNLGMREIVKLTQLKVLMLNDTKVSEEGLIDLKRLKKLELLSLNNTDISSSSVPHLKELPSLKWLTLADTNFTDADMVSFSEMSGLEEISVAGSPITDEGVSHLGKLTNLKIIDLKGTAITDAGLEYLKSLGNLQIIYLANTDVTKNAVAELQKNLPDCLIDVTNENSLGRSLELIEIE
ncbi:MAG: hypothetical protein HOF15_04065 [Planctomycetaceae bacterium]|nr:hypothetical protein [Planctomycetaceae bacterium]